MADICPKQRDDQSAEQSTTAAGKVANLREVPPDRTREVPADPTNPALDDAKQKAALDPSSPKPHPRRLRRILLFLGPLLLAVAGLYFYLSSGRYVSTDNAYVRADKLNVATDISGIVAAIAVTENQRVEKDEILFRLDDEPYRIALAGADAQLGVVRTEIATLQASYRQSLAQIEQTRTDVVGDVTLTTNTALYSSKEKSLAERNQRLGLCTN